MTREGRKGRILVVDDEVNARTALAELLRDEGYEVETAADAFKALGKYAESTPHVVLTDLKMPGMDGIELVKRIRAMPDPAAVVVMTAFGAVQSAVEAMRAGAVEYLTKPLNFDELVLVLDRVLEHQRLAIEARQLRARLEDRYARHNIIGSAPAMKWVFEVIDQVAPSRATVLITGESGTGKELVAAAIHQRSPRVNGPFIKVHCAALAETLLESELFGHERGAFTGAVARRDGRFLLADGGTLFLDEIGEVSPAVQVKLLRFLQEHEFERVGGDHPIAVDVRVIAATNRDLAQMVKDGKFREDLYYRLNVVTLEMPPLRDRKTDIPALAQYFFERFAKENGKTLEGFAPEALEVLAGYDWPGNVRELENAVERAVVMCQGARLEARHLPTTVTPRVESSEGSPPIPGSSLEAIERFAILRTLEATGGSTSKAAEILGISVRKIQYKLHEYNAAPKSSVDALSRGGGDDPKA
ncbi:MAG: sigma-54-dependent Fis family transcriptional regulator [Kofleriaceae bacterium]|nr:sigma-54-dependent Fis family transcriptional regulator [Myxococcales bacterium]MCB9565337.1 sigma-54-dependent Fis family transcriptional regulator [Kofleriaceae bacterium]